ncbi:TetR/AcrR family transcriptional regulator C-terminal domain-containing protein [Lacticaseibacillus daqingensis]|uniref:TetR/AcrR family transcriptional regulator C-terminal domain-containing protein n=1 Tax=Lacticaseibacillus daqingensis TaxID=2486014 RepID=UPI000F78A197|nr:TetR/AcrR family transcriptional regulator C-terminal domain-containing protein [Lacticaseibacillus daqingensis]
MATKTQQRITEATKQLVVGTPFSEINVTSIMKTAGLRRQTFYDYYRDKYDVLGDIYQHEIDAAVQYCGNYRYWPRTLHTMLAYFATNAAFYRVALAIDEQNAPEDVILGHLQHMIGQILHDMGAAETVTVDEVYIAFLQGMLSHAFVAALKAWLNDLKRPPVTTLEAQLSTFLTDGFNGFLARAKHPIALAQ